MGQPRAGRRRAVIVSSDDEDERSDVETLVGSKEPPTASKKGMSAKPSATKTKSRSSPSKALHTSPNKSKTKPAIEDEPKRANKSIYSFFNAATQNQRASQRSVSPAKAINEEQPAEEIQDELSGDDKSVPFAKGSQIASVARKRKLHSSPFANVESAPPSATQKFRKINDGVGTGRRAAGGYGQEDRRPWTEQFAPTDLSELAIHKKKVQDVRRLLESGLSSHAGPRLIVLKGAAGTGKTTTVKLLAKEFGADVLEWKNPVGADQSSTQFEDFVLRSGKYAGLQLVHGSILSTDVPPPEEPELEKEGPQIMLVEEFPNTYATSSTVLQQFRSTVQQYLALALPPSCRPTPLIMVISETRLSTSTASADSFTAHRLLGPVVLNHPGTAVIEFNAVAPTILIKALESMVVKEARRSGRRRTPGPQVLKHLAETGDIRSAVSSLEFLCLRGDDNDSAWSSKIAFTKPKRKAPEQAMTKQEEEALKLISNRESSLGIFHAVGKVVYNKRTDYIPVHNQSTIPEPPEYMSWNARSKVPEVDPDRLIDELGTDTNTFIASLHENYALSCSQPSSDDTLDSLNGCLDALSDSDMLSLDRYNFGNRAFNGSAQDNLRQDDMCFSVAVRGMLFALPSPVHRGDGGASTNSTGGSRGRSGFQMYYPASLRLWKAKEELDGTLDLVLSALQNTHLSAATHSDTRKDGVGTWKRPADSSEPVRSADRHEDTEPTPLFSLLSPSVKQEALLDRLPYASLILPRRPGMPSSLLDRIDTITSMRAAESLPPTSLDNEEDNLDETAEEVGMKNDWTTDRPDVDARGRGYGHIAANEKRKENARKRNVEGGGLHIPVVHEVEKLTLSDDDIED